MRSPIFEFEPLAEIAMAFGYTTDGTSDSFVDGTTVGTNEAMAGTCHPAPNYWLARGLNVDASSGNYGVAHTRLPLILAPSRAKQLYGETLRVLWRGLGSWGNTYDGFNIIGYSLPDDDGYVKQLLWRLSSGYVLGLDNVKQRLGGMAKMAVVDFRSGDDAVKELREHYQFVPQEHTDFILTGFDAASYVQ